METVATAAPHREAPADAGPPPARSQSPPAASSAPAPPNASPDRKARPAAGPATSRRAAPPPTRPRSSRYGREPRDGTDGSVNWRTYTSAKDAAGRVGKRCYRLNLERPFDIHCEQSPLEYGDYMTPWDKTVYPPTAGPVDYCPPRHLGGNAAAWRELMTYAGPDAADGAEEKVGSADMLEDDLHLPAGGDGGGDDPAASSEAEGRDDDDVAADSGEMAEDVEDPPASPVEGAGEEDGEDREDDYVEPAGNPDSATTGWRALTREQAETIEGLKGKDGETGEYTFATYDSSHQSPEELEAAQEARQYARRAGQEKERIDSRDELHTCLSNESDAADHRSAEEKADETARLFRRSELALREKAAREAEEARVKAEEERRLKEERKALERQQSGKGSKKRFSTKKLVRGMSKMMSSSGSSNDWASQRRASSGSMARKPSSSSQAAMIDKARDLVDESEDEADVVPGDLDANGKPKNVSLYVVGEFDALNDLVRDGARRLRDNKAGSDLDVLVQNKPCPPPDRWVAATGWSRCAPTSVYAKMPPADFDWVRYGDVMRTETYPRGDLKGKPIMGPGDEAKGKAAVVAPPAPVPRPAPTPAPADKGPRPANPAVPTESTSGGSSPVSEPAAAPVKASAPAGGAAGHFNKPAAAVEVGAGEKKKSRFGRKLSMGKKK